MNFWLSVGFSFSIWIAGILAILRFPNINRTYLPFVYLIWVGCVNETVSFLLIMNRQYSIVNSIVYGLCESLLLLWFFSNLGVFLKRRAVFWGCLILFMAAWIYESFLSKDFGSSFNNYFGIVYSFTVVLLGIQAINKLLFTDRDLLRNPAFLISAAIVIFFTYKVLVEMFTLYGLKESRGFRINVYFILMCINLFCNLVYAIAILWMQKKQAFTLQF